MAAKRLLEAVLVDRVAAAGGRPDGTSKPEFWNLFPDARATDFARFVALAKNGKLMAPWRAPEGQDRQTAERAYQKAELDRSLAYCRSLGLGTRA